MFKQLIGSVLKLKSLRMVETSSKHVALYNILYYFTVTAMRFQLKVRLVIVLQAKKDVM